MGDVIIISIVSLLLIFIGILISKYKCYWLISGYNTASKEENFPLVLSQIKFV